MHTCSGECVNGTHYDIAYSTEDMPVEAYTQTHLLPGLRLAQPGVEVISVRKLDTFDVAASQQRILHEVGHDSSGRLVRGVMTPRAAYGFRVRVREERACE